MMKAPSKKIILLLWFTYILALQQIVKKTIIILIASLNIIGVENDRSLMSLIIHMFQQKSEMPKSKHVTRGQGCTSTRSQK